MVYSKNCQAEILVTVTVTNMGYNFSEKGEE